MTVSHATESRVLPSEPLPLADVPVLDVAAFRSSVVDQCTSGGLVSALFATPCEDGRVRLYSIVSFRETGDFAVQATDVGDRYPAITPDCPQAHWFEREIAEQWGVVPEGHPWLKPIRFHASYRPGHDAWCRGSGDVIEPCVQPTGTSYYRVEGQEVHEVAAGETADRSGGR